MGLGNILLLTQATCYTLTLVLSVCTVVPTAVHVHNFAGRCLLYTTGTFDSDDGHFIARWASPFYCLFTLAVGGLMLVVSLVQLVRMSVFLYKGCDSSFLSAFLDSVVRRRLGDSDQQTRQCGHSRVLYARWHGPVWRLEFLGVLGASGGAVHAEVVPVPRAGEPDDQHGQGAEAPERLPRAVGQPVRRGHRAHPRLSAGHKQTTRRRLGSRSRLPSASVHRLFQTSRCPSLSLHDTCYSS
ncbi:uncharacterized protein ISCGN_020690 [Ixodes scapularis]